MYRGIYTAAGGMLSQQVTINTISNNMANSETTGYKKDISIMSPFEEHLMYHFEASNPSNKALGTMPYGVEVTGTEIGFKQGNLQWTGGQYDFALEGDGFFAVQTPNGVRLTRNGSFTVDDQSYLVTSQGYRVLGEDNFILVNGTDFVIKEDGTVLQDGAEAGKIALLDFEDRSPLQKEGDGLFSAPEDLDPVVPRGRVRQGYLESSNVEMSEEMSRVVVAFRAYEANSRVFQSFNEIMQLAVQNIGSLK